MSLNFAIRNWSTTDRAFVADAWLNSLRAGTDEARVANWESFKAHRNRAIDAILDDKGTFVRIAAPPADELTIYGYLVGTRFEAPSPPVLHMLFVKKPFRRQGVAGALLKGVPLEQAVCTQWTRDLGEWILRKSQKVDGHDRFGKPHLTGGLKYNPYWEASP